MAFVLPSVDPAEQVPAALVMPLNSTVELPDVSLTKRKCETVRRCCGVFAMDSLMSGFLNMFASIGGSGMLALPNAIGKAGYALGSIVLVAGMAVNLLTCYILCEYSRKRGLITLDQLFAATFQNQLNIRFLSTAANERLYLILHRLTGLNILLNNYGALIAYIIIIESLIPTATCRLGIYSGTPYYCIAIVLTIGFILPLSSFKAFSKLRFVSLASCLSTIYAVLVILVVSSTNTKKTNTEAYGSALGAFQTVAIVLYAYTCQPDVGLIVKELEDKEKSGVMIVFTLVVWMVIFFAVGLTGYAMSGGTGANILMEPQFDHAAAGIAMIFMTISLLCGTPILMYPIVEVAYNLFGEHRSGASRIGSFLVVAFLVTVALCFAILGQGHFVLVIGIVGTVSSCYVCLILPCLCYLLNPPDDETTQWMRRACWGTIVVTAVVSLVSLAALVIME